MKKIFESKLISVALITMIFVFSELGILWIGSISNTFAISNFGSFVLAIAYFVIVLKLLRIKKLGLALALSYSFVAILVTVTVSDYHGEQSGWYWIYLFILGMPATFLEGFFDSSLNSASSRVLTGLIYIVLGGTQYFLVGSYLQLVINKISSEKNLGKRKE